MHVKEEWVTMIDDLEELKFLARTKLISHERLTLTPAEMELLLLIYMKAGQLTPADISKIMHMKKESVSRVIKSLVNKGSIEKIKCPEDERSCRLILTEAGQKELDINYKKVLTPIYYLKQSMGEEFRVFIDMVIRANNIMKQYEEEL